MKYKVQNADNKYAVFTETDIKSPVNSSLTYRKSLTKEVTKRYSLLIINKLVEKALNHRHPEEEGLKPSLLLVIATLISLITDIQKKKD